VHLLPKLRVEVATPDERTDEVVDTIAKAAKTSQIGDGKIFVHSLKQAQRIRTGETGTSAL
jgi:nitrogen regulatory protein P-II 2